MKKTYLLGVGFLSFSLNAMEKEPKAVVIFQPKNVEVQNMQLNPWENDPRTQRLLDVLENQKNINRSLSKDLSESQKLINTQQTLINKNNIALRNLKLFPITAKFRNQIAEHEAHKRFIEEKIEEFQAHSKYYKGLELENKQKCKLIKNMRRCLTISCYLNLVFIFLWISYQNQNIQEL